MVHEVGHAHGREHSPGCNAPGPDPFYPHTDGYIGTWGYDMENEEIKDPWNFYDFMTYCSPTWVSDYTYNGLHTRIGAVNNLAAKKGPAEPARAWASLRIDIDESAEQGPVFWLEVQPRGRALEVELFDSQVQQIGTTTGWFQRTSLPPAGLVVFPEPAADVAFVRLPEGELVPFEI
jgi:hypothetical protein